MKSPVLTEDRRSTRTAVVISPTYNERGNIERTLQALLDAFKKVRGWDMHILIVDDTSPDKTYEIVEQWSKKHTNVHLLLNKKKSGLGGAYLKGMEHAFEKLNADVVFEFDADLSHDPTKIPQFLEEIERGGELVLGTRYKFGGTIPKNWGWHRKLLSIGGNAVIMTILGNFRYRDWTSGYRALTKKVYQAVSPHLQSEQFHGYTFQIGFLYTALKLGFDVREAVPYKFVDRSEGVSKLGPEYIKNNLLFIMKIRIKDLLENRIVKFVLVGGIGTLVQLSSLLLYRAWISDPRWYEAAVLLSIETAIISNFILNSIWTFKDKKFTAAQVPSKFIAFNVSSIGSVLLQLGIAAAGKRFIGLFPLFTLPVLGVTIDSGTVYVVIGILLGMVWNFFAYTKLIWKT